ncbi:MAG: hypothetical protein IH586_01270, partial [Anaerolineaceae bacterium]|nr:hypothetical protein [Anaerolineaceae bacterium]
MFKNQILKAMQRWTVVAVLFLAGMACNFPRSPFETRQAPSVSPETEQPLSLQANPIQQATPSQPLVPPQSSSTVVSMQAYQAVFEEAACAFAVPGGQAPRCGYLIVPENRARPGSPSIRLHVAVFRSSAGSLAADPVIYLSGGPGSPALDLVGYLFRHGLDAVLERSDLIVFDQRGTGYSLPRLDCPERQGLAADLLAHGLIAGDAGKRIEDAFERCRDRLSGNGVDLTSYNSAASAA